MKKTFYLGLFAWVAFEISKTYLIMPMPGSQQASTVELAHFLHSTRWIFRAAFFLWLLLGIRPAWQGRKWVFLTATGITAIVLGFLNLKLSADKMFLPPILRNMATLSHNQVPLDRLVIGIEYKGEARAYPIQSVAYHHQVLDTIQDKAFMVTYCSVCRTGRVFEPMVAGKQETFRLVGMDHFNALFEDATTGTWWQQATGEAVAGKLKGQSLPEFPILQTTLRTWLELHPDSRILQPDPHFEPQYAHLEGYEEGAYSGGLTGTDKTPWAEKAWVVGVEVDGKAKAFDWHALMQERMILDEVGETSILLTLASDDQSFFALERPGDDANIRLSGDTLIAAGHRYHLDGRAFDSVPDLKPVRSYQEFWHSWRTFHANTERYMGRYEPVASGHRAMDLAPLAPTAN